MPISAINFLNTKCSDLDGVYSGKEAFKQKQNYSSVKLDLAFPFHRCALALRWPSAHSDVLQVGVIDLLDAGTRPNPKPEN